MPLCLLRTSDGESRGAKILLVALTSAYRGRVVGQLRERQRGSPLGRARDTVDALAHGLGFCPTPWLQTTTQGSSTRDDKINLFITRKAMLS